MRNRLKRKYLYCIAALALMLITFVFAYKTYDFSFLNHYGTGSVKLSVGLYQMDSDGNRVAARTATVLPGETVSYIPEITNNRANCYVRVHLETDMKDENCSITADNISGLEDGWIRNGENLYYTREFKHGESIDVFRELIIPSDLAQDDAEDGFTVTVIADAIQSDNFDPDFDAELPWGSVQIEREKEDDPIDYDRGITPYRTPNELRFSGEGGLESETEDLFGNFSYFMAGDEFQDSLRVKNQSDHRIRLFFRVKDSEGSLNDQTELTISSKGKKIYQGFGRDPSEQNVWHELTAIDAGRSVDLDFSLKLPMDTRQEYTVLRDDVVWEFRTVTDAAHRDAGVVRTGDEARALIWIILIICTGIMIVIMIGRRDEDEIV